MLTDTFVRKVKHKGAAIGERYADGGGMYLRVKAAGKYWRMDYRFHGKAKTRGATGAWQERAPGAAYDRAEFMEKRKVMMQRWADYLDKLAAGADVLKLKAA